MYFFTHFLSFTALTAATAIPGKRAGTTADLGAFHISTLTMSAGRGDPGSSRAYITFEVQEPGNSISTVTGECSAQWDFRGDGIGWPHGPIFCNTTHWEWYFLSREPAPLGAFTLELTHGYRETPDGELPRMYREKYARHSFQTSDAKCYFASSGNEGCTWTDLDIPVYNQTLLGPIGP